MEVYCLKCKKKVEPVDGKNIVVETKKGFSRHMHFGKCPDCKGKVSRILAKPKAEEEPRPEPSGY